VSLPDGGLLAVTAAGGGVPGLAKSLLSTLGAATALPVAAGWPTAGLALAGGGPLVAGAVAIFGFGSGWPAVPGS
jgi:hypothetical protein